MRTLQHSIQYNYMKDYLGIQGALGAKRRLAFKIKIIFDAEKPFSSKIQRSRGTLQEVTTVIMFFFKFLFAFKGVWEDPTITHIAVQ